ncbi:hypothetical protein ACHAXM_005542 [Skeletonema potamos]
MSEHVDPYDILREPSPMISDSGETSSERGGMMMQALAAAAATNYEDMSPRHKVLVVHEDDVEDIIFIPTQHSNNSGSSRNQATTVTGRSPRLQGQTGALLNRADPFSLSTSGPTTALDIMRRSAGGRSNSDTSGSAGATHNQDGGVPRSVVASSVSPPSAAEEMIAKSMTPVISNVDTSRRGSDRSDDYMIDPRRGVSNMPPTTTMDYQPSQFPGGGGGYPQYVTAHDIHRARWEQEQRELAADYYPSVNNYPFDYYSPARYYQQQINQPSPASLRYHHHQHLSADTNNTADLLALEHRLQVEQRLQEYYQPRVAHQLPLSMVVLPHQAQAAQQQQRVSQHEGGGAPDSKPPARSGSPGVSSVHRHQVHLQQNRSGSPGLSSLKRNQSHQVRNHSQQQQQPPLAYEARDWRTNQVWREDYHSHTTNLGGPSAIERRHSERSSADMPKAASLPPRKQNQPNPQGRVPGSMTIDQYEITHAQMYGHSPYLQDFQQPPPHPSATPSPPPGSLPAPSTPMMSGIDPRLQQQMNLMAMMFQHQQSGGIPPHHVSPIPPGLMYPPQYYPPQHDFYQGSFPGAVGQPPMPREVIVPTKSATQADKAAAGTADTSAPPPHQSPEPQPAGAPPTMPRDKSLKKKVSFSHLQIRTYETILGDNPSCTGGPSLSIGWRYNPEHFNSTVDEYERKQDELYGGPEIRPLDIDLVLHRSERESILMRMGYTQPDLAEAVRRLNKAKSRRRQTVHNLPVMFLEEKAESFKRTVGRLFLNRQRTRHMYDEWKKSDSIHFRQKGSPNERRRNSV